VQGGDELEPSGFAGWASRVGARATELVEFVGSLLHFLGEAARAARRGVPGSVLIGQVYEVGARSLPLTAVAAFAMGVVMAIQTMVLLKKFGVVQYAAVGVGLGLTRELAPVVTALMVAGRAGSGISAELGSMQVTRQIDALRVLAVDPYRYLAATRILACLIAVPLLTALSDFIGIFGGLVVTTTLGGVPVPAYIDTTLYYVTVGDVLSGIGKSAIFGLIIGTVAAHYGFQTTGGTTGVGRATTATVVVSSLMIFVSDVVLTQILMTLGF
jgi:phospholipid/cholesterol/gamma-HCH transport system permease protein